jgi:hypothetical protein
MCIDCRALNKVTIKNRYLLPQIDDLLDQIFFTNMDLKLGYHQVRIKEKDVWKKTFKIRQGLCLLIYIMHLQLSCA